MKKIAFIAIVILVLSIGTTANAYEVYSCWTSKDGWGEPTSNFTTNSERVYFNVAASYYETFITNKWFRPDGTREDDTGTNLLAHPVYEGGLFVGFWTYMVIKGKNREEGQWRVEHWVLKLTLRNYVKHRLNQLNETGNEELKKECIEISGTDSLNDTEAASVILKELWKRLRETYRLRVVR